MFWLIFFLINAFIKSLINVSSHFPKSFGRREWVGSVGYLSCLKAVTIIWQADVVAKSQAPQALVAVVAL